MNTLELFKRIPDTRNYYVSSWGKVYRKNDMNFLFQDGVVAESRSFREIYQETTEKGYKRVTLRVDGKKKHKKVHRLVANAFIPNPEGKPQVNHIDGNKHNNSITNLEWVTDAENKEHYKQITDKEKPYAN